MSIVDTQFESFVSVGVGSDGRIQKLPILNQRAVYLAEPEYPRAARTLSAFGDVIVLVTVNGHGRVVSASAVEGDELLRKTAVVAALASRFPAAEGKGKGRNYSGVLKYNFSLPFSPTWIGFELAYAERTGRFDDFALPKHVNALIPKDWNEERELLEKLSYSALPDQSGSHEGAESSDLRAFPDQRSSTPAELKAELASISHGIFDRLEPSALDRWSYRLGAALARFVTEADEPNSMRRNGDEIAILLGEAPHDASKSFIFYVRQVIFECQESDLSYHYRRDCAHRVKRFKRVNFQ